ncbi:RNA-guided endonuclease InsQ/TnpB family protein, partial [Oceanobacillus locisalsi]
RYNDERGYLPIEFKPLSYRVSREGLHWFVSITVEIPDSPDYSTPVNEPIGIDLGIKTLATVSDGSVYVNINQKHEVRKMEKRLRRLQRQVSRKYKMNKEGSRYRKTCNIIKTEKEIARLQTRLNNIRTNYIHQMTSEIVRTKPSHIVMEDLNVRGMMKNKHLADHVAKCNFREIRRQLTYKANQSGVSLVVADRWYPSSRTCCECGVIDKTLKLSDRKMKCECGNRIDRDMNASINLSRLAV